MIISAVSQEDARDFATPPKEVNRLSAAATAVPLPAKGKTNKHYCLTLKNINTMGKIKQGILGAFIGKVGTVIGSVWKGKAVMRSVAPSTHDPKTAKQVQQRAKFGLVSKFLAKIQGFLRVGYGKSATGMTELNAAFKRNFDDIISGTYPNLELAYDKMVVTKGNLDLPYNPSAVVDSNVLNVSWTDNSGAGNAEETDESMILAYNSAKEQAVFTLAGGSRAECLGSLTLPTAWSGDSVDVWFSMRNIDTDTCSTSVYLGNISI